MTISREELTALRAASLAHKADSQREEEKRKRLLMRRGMLLGATLVTTTVLLFVFLSEHWQQPTSIPL